MWFKKSGISRLFLSLCKHNCRTLQNYGYEENRKVDEASSFYFYIYIYPLSATTWKWVTPIMIEALVAQDNCLAFVKSVTVSLAYSISPPLETASSTLAFYNVLSLKLNVLWVPINKNKQKKRQYSKHKAGLYSRNNSQCLPSIYSNCKRFSLKWECATNVHYIRFTLQYSVPFDCADTMLIFLFNLVWETVNCTSPFLG